MMPLRSTRRLLVALAAIVTAAGAGVLTAAPAMAGTGTGALRGHVELTDGSPAPDITLLFATGHSDEPNHRYAVTTDAQGDYAVSDVVPDHYAVVLPSENTTWSLGDSRSVSVAAGAVVDVPTTTVVRLAVLNGTVTSSVDGLPVAGRSVYAGGVAATTAADGSFTIRTTPGWIEVQAWGHDWLPARRKVWVDEGRTRNLVPLTLDPAGTVSTRILGRNGRSIRSEWQSAVVDGCRADLDHTCPKVALPGTGSSSLQLTPGPHTVRYEVSNPATSTVRHVTRTVLVTQGETTTLPPVVVRVDPWQVVQLRSSSYRRGHPVTVRVNVAQYLDGTRPHLRTTFLVDGHRVAPTSRVWRTGPGTSNVLVAELPARWSKHKTLSIRAVVHGTTTYGGQTSMSSRLVRDH